MDTRLAFELNRTDVADRRMASGRVVESLDVIEHICSGLVPGAIGFALGSLSLQ